MPGEDPFKQILVVDDTPATREAVAAFLRQEGHRVHLARSAFDALAAVRDHRPDMIFVEQVMPRIAGDDLCRILKSLPGLDRSVMVLISDVAREESGAVESMAADVCIARASLERMGPMIRELIARADQVEGRSRKGRVMGGEHLHARAATRKLLSRTRHLHVLLENLSQGVLEMEEGQVVYFNRAAQEILGIPEQTLLGTPLRHCLEPELWSHIAPLLEGAGKARKGDLLVSGGRHLDVQCLALGDRAGHRILLFTDYTRVRQMESAMEGANLSENLGYVFSGVRHEMGNPVGALKMALSNLKRRMDSYDRSTIAHQVELCLEAVSRMSYLLEKLRNYSLFESPRLGPVSMATFMDAFMALVRRDFEDRNLILEAVLPGEDVTAWADDRALHHILLNLMTNAADACDGRDKGRILVQVEAVPPWVEIRVVDNGRGIPESDLEYLFQPFFTTKAHGTGLGLVIVRNMVGRMKGRIEVGNGEEGGACVILQLPGEGP